MSHSTQPPPPGAQQPPIGSVKKEAILIDLCGDDENSLSTIDFTGQRYKMSGDRYHVDQQMDVMEHRLDECCSNIRKNRQDMDDLKNLMVENTNKSKVLFSIICFTVLKNSKCTI